MGFFDLFKKKKQSALQLPEKFSSGFIQPLTSQRLEIKLGEKLIVNDGWSACIVVKDKPQDVFGAGEYELNLPMIPRTTRALKLDKSRIVKHKGKQEVVFKNSFKCDLYFVNMAPFTLQPWQANRVSKKNKLHGKFNVALNGTCTFQTTNVVDSIKLFLLEWAKIPAGKAQGRLLEYISEFASSALEWSRVSEPEIINDKVKIAEIIKEGVSKNLNKYGIALSDFVVDEVIFDRNISAYLEQKKRDEPEIKADEIVNNLNLEKESEPVTINLDNASESTVSVEKDSKQTNADAQVVNLDEANIENEKVVLKKDNKKSKKSKKIEKIDEKLSENKENTKENAEVINLDNGKDEKVETNPEPLDFTTMSDAELLKSIVKKGSKKAQNNDKAKESENDLPENSKKCPNCGKIHNSDDKICDCGCNLE